MSKSSKPSRPDKPYPDFPLYPHATRRWAKKIRGTTHYFGPWEDHEGSLKKYLAQRDDLHAGRTPRPTSEAGPTLFDVSKTFIAAKEQQLNSGELSIRTFDDYYTACKKLMEFFGKDRLVLDLRPEDFGEYRAKLAETRGPVAIGNVVVRVRCLFTWAFDNDHLDKPIRYGSAFAVPSKKIKRRAKREGGTRMLEAAEIRKLIAEAKQPVKAMILLGINCGLGQSDIAALTVNEIDLNTGWINFPRPKTEVERRCPLWPETVQAIEEAIEVRPHPKKGVDPNLVFITRLGIPWVRCKVNEPTEEKPTKRRVFLDSVGQAFAKLLTKLKIERRGSFYNLRHSHRTVSDATKDQPACDLIMGHTEAAMSGEYRERIDDSRLQAVADHVREWLYKVPPSDHGQGGGGDGDQGDGEGDGPRILKFKSA